MVTGMWLDEGMNTYRIVSKADTRSKARRVRMWDIEAVDPFAAIDVARERHMEVIGWNGAIWISKCEEV
jgi:hypothetical protein